MQVEYKFKIGADEFTIRADVSNHTEFFQAMGFYANLPKTGPNGENDLKLTYRKVREYEYYSIVSQEAGQEYALGQYKGDSGNLFEKDWQPLYKKPGEGEDEESDEKTSGSRFSKSEKSESKSERFSKSTKKSAPKEEEPEEEESEETESEETSEEEQQEEKAAAPKEAPTKESKPAAGGSKMSTLMAKYCAAPKAGSTSNLRR